MLVATDHWFTGPDANHDGAFSAISSSSIYSGPLPSVPRYVVIFLPLDSCDVLYWARLDNLARETPALPEVMQNLMIPAIDHTVPVE